MLLSRHTCAESPFEHLDWLMVPMLFEDSSFNDVQGPDLATRLQEYVSDVLQYACIYWLAHLSSVEVPDLELVLRTEHHTRGNYYTR
jgi:hypothetical protein